MPSPSRHFRGKKAITNLSSKIQIGVNQSTPPIWLLHAIGLGEFR
jgi:hypothetical protein